MLTRLSIKNFRLLRDVTIDVEPGKPIVLIGPNGAGKSSVIHVLDLLGRAARDGWEAADKAFSNGSYLPGGDPFLQPSMEVMLGRTQLDGHPGEVWGPYRYQLDLHVRDVEHEYLDGYPDGVDHESGVHEALPLVLPIGPLSGDDFWLWNHRTKERDKQEPAYKHGLCFETVKHQDYPYLRQVQELLASMRVYDGFLATPLWARDVREGRLTPFDGSVVEPCPRIDRRGLDLINALYYLQSSHPHEWDELERNFKAEFPFVQRLEFPPDPAGGRIGLGWRDRRYPGVRMHGHQMSEGMAAYLCLLAAILTPDRATAIAFDEPDRHLHPSAVRRVVYLLEKLSEHTAVFVATHSDRFLDDLSDPAGSLRVCEPSDEGVTVRKLDRDALEAWRAAYTLSELRAQGQIDPRNADGGAP